MNFRLFSNFKTVVKTQKKQYKICKRNNCNRCINKFSRWICHETDRCSNKIQDVSMIRYLTGLDSTEVKQLPSVITTVHSINTTHTIKSPFEVASAYDEIN